VGALQDVRRLQRPARLRNADHQRAVEARRGVVNGRQRGRRQPDEQPGQPAQRVLGIARRVIGRAARHDQRVARLGLPDRLRDLRYVRALRVQQPLQGLRLFKNFVFESCAHDRFPDYPGAPSPGAARQKKVTCILDQRPRLHHSAPD